MKQADRLRAIIKRKTFKRIAAGIAIVIILFLLMIPCNFHPSFFVDTLWKYCRFRPTLQQFDSLNDKYDEFVGMDIEDVLTLLTKKGRYYIYSKDSITMRMTYDEIVESAPWLSLDGERAVMYWFFIGRGEGVYSFGFYVNTDGIVIEPYESPLFV